ncbi:MAG: glycosyltransferase family 2 protein [Clostridia bacterium]|nr:glycosyltransferase family 2 protein [Clostridia bacterium]
MDYKVSVVIPMYNVKAYFKDCMDSLLNQTIGFNNIEVIIVDDHSDDGSFEMAKEYEKKYNNITVTRTEERSKVAGHPRNVGIKLATGKYLMFTDPDDFYTLDACEIMYNAIEEKKADFINANWRNADEDGTPWEKPVFDLEKYKDFEMTMTDYRDSFFVMNSSMCNKIFNREFIMKNNIKCLEGVPAEDAYFTMSSFLVAKKVFYISNIIYNYRQRNNNSLSVSWNCSREYFSQINTAYKALYEKFVEFNKIDFYRFMYARSSTYMLYKFIDSTLLTDEDRIEILSEMRWYYKLGQTLNVPACQKSLSILLRKIIAGSYKDVIDICKIIAEVRSYMTKDMKERMSKPYTEMYNEMMKSKWPIED